MVFIMTKQFPGDQGFNTDAAELSNLPQPPPQPPSECPRCSSINTKFCYYNNYNKSQPRHFCKSCKRHWTKGGTLRNIPAGRRRKNKRPRTSAAAAAVKAEPQQKHNLENLLSLSIDQKNMSNILYQALIHSSSSPSTSIPHSTILESNGTTHSAALNASAPQDRPNTEFTFSSFTSLISNPTSDYYQSSNDYNVDNSAEESTVTTSAAPPWPAVSTAADVWSWNDGVDLMGDMNTAWDHLTFLEGTNPR